jgi:hypothetical protein
MLDNSGIRALHVSMDADAGVRDHDSGSLEFKLSRDPIRAVRFSFRVTSWFVRFG